MTLQRHSNIELKEIPGHEGYLVSREGRVFSRWASGSHKLMPTVQRELRPVNLRGYLMVRLRPEKSSPLLVHRLVLLTFVSPCPPDKPYGCHRNGDSLDNRVENLRWDTPTGNAADRKRHGTAVPPSAAFRARKHRGEENGLAKLNDNSAREIRTKYATGNYSYESLAREYGVSGSTVFKLVRGMTWRHV